MAEIATPPPVSTPPPAEAPKGIAGVMANIDKLASEPPKVEGDKGDKGATPPPKVEGDQPPKETPPKDEGDKFWDKAPPQYKNAFFKHRRETQERMTSAEKKLAELEKRPQTPANDARIKELETQIEASKKERDSFENRLRESDYRNSGEFREKYVARVESAYKDAIREVKALNVSEMKDETETKRPATQEDFDYVLSLPPRDQDRVIDQMFGVSSKRVMLHIAELNRLQRDGNEAIANAAKTAAEKQKLTAKEQETQAQEFQRHRDSARGDLTSQFPQFFAPDENNPEATKALDEGYKFVDETTTNADKFSTQERAERLEVVRGWAAAFPRLFVLNKQNEAKIKSLQDELAKYRKSDPGSAGDRTPAGTPPASRPKGIEGAMQMLDEAVAKGE